MVVRFFGFLILFSQIILAFSECGLNFNDKFENRIVGGKEAIPYSWPSMVRFFMYYEFDDQEPIGFCGGTLIDKETIISAAHCFPRPPPTSNITIESIVRVKIGIHSLSEGEPLEVKSVLIVSINSKI